MSDSDSAHPLIGWLCACGVVIIWSGWVVVSRLGVVLTLTPDDIMMLRFSVATVAVAPFVWRYWPRDLRWWQIATIACGQGVPYLLLSFHGLQFAPASHAGVMINGTLPILTAALGWWWLKVRPGRQQVIGVLVILIGCSLIGLDRSSSGVTSKAWVGHIMFFGAAIFVAVNMIATRAWGLTPRQAMVCIPTVNLVFFAPYYLASSNGTLSRAPWAEILLQGLYQGLGPSVLAVLLFTMAIRSIGPTSTAATMAAVPGVTTLMAIPILSEAPSAIAWAGLALATIGIVLAAARWTSRVAPP